MSELDNIKIVPGRNIPYHEVYRNNSQFNYIEFKDVEVHNFNGFHDSVDNWSDTERRKLCKAMRGKQAVLWLRSMGSTGGLVGNEGHEIMSATDAEKYRDLPCCFQTPYGTLVPQVVVPTKNVIDNGMEFPEGTVGNITQGKKEGGYTWMPVLLDAADYQGRNTTLLNQCVSSQSTYGERMSLYKCVTNEHSERSIVDNPIYATRKYTCNTANGAAGSGSCAICYKIVKNKEIGDGATASEKELAPMVKIQLAGRMNNNGVSQEVNTIGAVIAKSGQMIGVVGDNVGQGSLPEPSSDIMPPHCQKTGDTYDLYPLFMYPLYNGFVMTNSVISNLKEGNNGIFIRYDEELLNPIYTATIYYVNKSHEMETMQAYDDTSELMKWFPTLYQECRNKNEITIKVPRSEKIDFADTISLDFYKSLGRFAYCPIYFHRKVKFTLFFKGEYRDQYHPLVNTYGTYRFYPVVCANIGENTTDEWTGISSRGATCLTNVRYVVSDDSLQESIYAVDFEFYADSLQRYPIEIFGAVAVCERPDFQFAANGENGSFEFDKPVLDMFTGFVEEQRKFDDCKIQAPDTGSKNNWGGDMKLFGLIQNVGISASLDGVSGSMTLDGYPLKQGLKIFKQDQSIGELDLAVVHKGVKHNLFSGYAMSLSTSDGDNNYSIGVELAGVNRKLELLKLICAPFWDGDRLEMISAYFEEYAKIQIRMIDHTVESYDDAKYVNISPYFNGDESRYLLWSSDSNTIVNSVSIAHPSFRVPRSCDWRSPAVNFNTGTPVMEALKTLGQLTGCVCVPQLDGSVTFYELNNLGYPFYVDNQTDIVEFDPTEVVSISMQPELQNKYNSVATFGFLRRKNAEGKILAEENVEFGSFYSRTNDGSMPNVGVQYPWSNQSVGVESAMLTKLELAEIHQNRVKMMTSDIYLGNMTVKGNTKVNHIYQKVRVAGQEYFVISIEHSLDLSSKIWTTSYQLQCIDKLND